MSGFLSLTPFKTPDWASRLTLVPKKKCSLAMLPTPIHRWDVPGVPDGVELYIKRDDLSGMQMSGNKVRKLEFLMADALEGGYDSVITIGGIQSNHCRATATAAKYLGLDVHLILRNSERQADEDPGLVGNLLVERLQGAHIHQVTKAEYGTHGSTALCETLKKQLEATGKRPYVIPVGGSNSLGTWGYMMAMDEINQQCAAMDLNLTDIAMACGSGATTAGLAVANKLTQGSMKVHGYCVCDDESYFYDFIDDLMTGLGLRADEVTAREIVKVVQCKGAGYAISREDELKTMLDIAVATGIVMDPVYSGKAMHQLVLDMQADPKAWQGKKILFIHTGGLLGMYEKIPQMQPLVEKMGTSHRLDLSGA